jgi:hypothetical protein
VEGQTTGVVVPDRLSQLYPCQNSRFRRCQSQIDVPGAGHQHDVLEGNPEPVDRLNRRGQVLAAGCHRAQNRVVADIFIACVDDLKGFPEAAGWCTRNGGATVRGAHGAPQLELYGL